MMAQGWLDRVALPAVLRHHVLEVLERRVIQYDVLLGGLLVESRVRRSLLNLFTLSSRDTAEASHHFLHGVETCTTLCHFFLSFEYRDVYNSVATRRC